MNVIQELKDRRIIPVAVLENKADTERVLGGLVGGGLPVAEITYRTAYAEQAIADASEMFPDMLIGVGTILSGAQCACAIKAGAKFIVSPGLSEEVSFMCMQKKVPYFPGAVTPTEIMKAITLGHTVVKFFPASIYGGMRAIKALSAAFGQISFIPTGGVESNLKEFLAFNKIFAVGGSFMTMGSAEEIAERTRKIVAICERD